MNYLITGASRGLGDALARGLPSAGDTVYLVSRSTPPSLALQDGIARHWLEADLNREDAAEIIAGGLTVDVIDVLIHNAGIWARVVNQYVNRVHRDALTDDRGGVIAAQISLEPVPRNPIL